jgi:pimeloyl-ACP methyl ester carboxylesterase
MHFTSLLCKLRAGFFISEASAIKQVQKSVVPILFIHGSADRFVPAKMVHELYGAATCPKQLLVVQDAAHGTSFWKDSLGYQRILKDFLERCHDLSS